MPTVCNVAGSELYTREDSKGEIANPVSGSGGRRPLS